ncbi:QacE family quaternary ammonium compound efflux SMR transporter [Acidiphilium sp. AL]|uniref:SMR family transporter n=1 Tax=Acidiphilium iwatense TaxID=768198 RepID=A0ABS9E047_9PROT|nr:MULTISPECIES: SMR family transporter [Acidiphilium]MCF3948375.1 SMR family transporter [Acidiphilium iwatense]MCU4161855.1 QacE family quaternary ammonium compound efflux SMR transporter [Acidiphilium sp. AL]
MTTILTYFLLLGAILSEVVGTSLLKASQQFTRLVPAVLTIVAYAASFYLLSVIVRTVPVGIVYAIWSGMGIVLISLVGWVVYRQALDISTMIGLGLIVAGVIVVNLSSSNIRH